MHGRRPRDPDLLRSAGLQFRRPRDEPDARPADDPGLYRLRLRGRAIGIVRGHDQGPLSPPLRRCRPRRQVRGRSLRRPRPRTVRLPRRRARRDIRARPLRGPHHLPRRLLRSERTRHQVGAAPSARARTRRRRDGNGRAGSLLRLWRSVFRDLRGHLERHRRPQGGRRHPDARRPDPVGRPGMPHEHGRQARARGQPD